MSKRRRYTDEFRANAVLMLEAAGYPGKEGAMTAVSKRLGVPHATLSRWARQVQNPAPSEMVHEKRFDLVTELTELLGLTIQAAKGTVNDADYRELATAIGIFTDKIQLLTGNVTERTETTVRMPEQERRERFNAIVSEYSENRPRA